MRSVATRKRVSTLCVKYYLNNSYIYICTRSYNILNIDALTVTGAADVNYFASLEVDIIKNYYITAVARAQYKYIYI